MPIVRFVGFYVLLVGLWQVIYELQIWPPYSVPGPEQVFRQLERYINNGILFEYTVSTMQRMFIGFGLAFAIGMSIGVLNATVRWADETLGTLVLGMQSLPSITWLPLAILWFGLGNISAVLLVGFVSAFPIIFNSWTGVKAVKEIWVRSAQSMGANDRSLFRHVILPGALPYILTGMRLGLAQAWRILVAVEMLAAVPWGLGWLIFGARKFLNTDAMMAGIVVIAIIGLALEKFVFQKIENYTVVRWGMITS
jgi:NitT/TauT family transport system permease protein